MMREAPILQITYLTAQRDGNESAMAEIEKKT
jgi:hypothetical protein